MGCFIGKPFLDSPYQDLQRKKLVDCYFRGRSEVTRNDQRRLKTQHSGPLKSLLENETNGDKYANGAKNGGRAWGGGGERRVSENRERETGIRNLPTRIPRPRKKIEDELVDGWPKWLVDNIPKHALDVLVPKSADSYDKLAQIGHGTYSNVYKARERATGKIVALKKVRFNTSEPESIKFMAREIRILQKLDHPNVIKLRGLATSRMQYSLYLVFDFMQSDLTRIISHSNSRLTETQIKSYMKQLLAGLSHCHERGILHRDIKTSNLLIDRRGVLKIADFGLANFFSPKSKQSLTNRVVTLWYRAPELLLGSTHYGPGIDIWSAGCLLAEMFAGKPLMPGRNEIEQLHTIFKLCGTPSDDYWKTKRVPANFRPQHKYKPRLQETFKNFPSSARDLLITLLDLDPVRRGSATSALQSEFFNSTPLPCDLSELPEIHSDKNEALQIKICKNRSSLEEKKQIQDEVRLEIEVTTDESESVKEDKEEESSTVCAYTSHSTSSTVSGSKYFEKKISMPASMSPLRQVYKSRIPENQSHPNGRKNLTSYSGISQPSITDVIKDGVGKQNGQISRTLSLNYRSLDPDRIPEFLTSDEDFPGHYL